MVCIKALQMGRDIDPVAVVLGGVRLSLDRRREREREVKREENQYRVFILRGSRLLLQYSNGAKQHVRHSDTKTSSNMKTTRSKIIIGDDDAVFVCHAPICGDDEAIGRRLQSKVTTSQAAKAYPPEIVGLPDREAIIISNCGAFKPTPRKKVDEITARLATQSTFAVKMRKCNSTSEGRDDVTNERKESDEKETNKQPQKEQQPKLKPTLKKLNNTTKKTLNNSGHTNAKSQHSAHKSPTRSNTTSTIKTDRTVRINSPSKRQADSTNNEVVNLPRSAATSSNSSSQHAGSAYTKLSSLPSGTASTRTGIASPRTEAASSRTGTGSSRTQTVISHTDTASSVKTEKSSHRETYSGSSRNTSPVKNSMTSPKKQTGGFLKMILDGEDGN